MAVFFNSARLHRDPKTEWGERVGNDLIETVLEYELGARTLRSHMFDPHVINDSSWILVQDLFAAHLKGLKMRTKELCATSGLPQTTVLRYLDHLESPRDGPPRSRSGRQPCHFDPDDRLGRVVAAGIL